MSDREQVLSQLSLLNAPPIAFEALWDGDSSGWFICLSAITNDMRSHGLGIFQNGGDIRIFNGQVPPWPEAVFVTQLGNELAERFGAEFYFPSPHYPEDDCPKWQDRAQGYPCRRCGILLLQPDRRPWRGMCYRCHLDEEREKREASWTQEERAGPRCYICGNPAITEWDRSPVCKGCVEKYTTHICEKCGSEELILKSIDHNSICIRCEREQLMELLTASQRIAIQNAIATHRAEGLAMAKKILGCPLNDAYYVMCMLDSSNVRKGDDCPRT